MDHYEESKEATLEHQLFWIHPVDISIELMRGVYT